MKEEELDAQVAFVKKQIGVLRAQAELLRKRPDWFILLLGGKRPEALNRVSAIFIEELTELLATNPEAFSPEAVARSLEAQANELEVAITFN